MTPQNILHVNHSISATYLISSEGLLAASRRLCPSADIKFPPRLQKYTKKSKGLITLCVVPVAFSFYLAFFILPRVFGRVFGRVLDTNMLVSKTRVKTREKCKKNARKIQNTSLTRENVSILHYALCKNASQSRFARILLAFCSRFARVLLAFCSCFAHKHDQNANPTHSVIRP